MELTKANVVKKGKKKSSLKLKLKSFANPGVIVERLRAGFVTFSDGTSCHGFSELLHSKHIFWTSFWVIVVATAFGATAYQIYRAIYQYLDQNLTTVIFLASEKEILYPPLRLCYGHWLFWLDWQRCVSLNYSREAVLFSLSYVYNVISSTVFDENEAKNQFLSIMARKNFSTLTQFYASVAKPAHVTYNDNDTRIPLDRVGIVYSKNSYLFCYTLQQERVYDVLYEETSHAERMFKTRDFEKELTFEIVEENYRHYKNVVTEDEYGAYMKAIVENGLGYKINDTFAGFNLTEYSPAVYLYPDRYGKKYVKITAENEAYYIDFRASACSWKNKPSSPCFDDTRSLSSNSSCKFKCEAWSYRLSCSCQFVDKAVAINEDQFYKVCLNGVVFLDSSYNVANHTIYNRLVDNYNETAVCWFDQESESEYARCLQKCRDSCEIWTWDYGVTVSASSALIRRVARANVTKVVVAYPSGNDIIVMREVESQTWENFVGNVGGLLGIWTGASVLSVLQLFYLCCCGAATGDD